MGMKVKFVGLNKAKAKLTEQADMKDVIKAVRKSTVEVQEQTKRNMGTTYNKRYKSGSKAGKRISTGQTKRMTNVYFEDNGLKGIIRPETEYFQYVELGTRYMAKEPTLKPALDTIYPVFLERIKRAAEGS
ncbi:phage tail protein [Companilactobacillus furfuricola]|uniref:phage tail protein n=1 Tax=Companilactobacillus furfuricola TaxID=1462575 RepID=UPI000F768759|nr:phage tail protein [Companilactobacillus furfuricola]